MFPMSLMLCLKEQMELPEYHSLQPEQWSTIAHKK